MSASNETCTVFIRRCRPAEYASVGRMIAEAYAGLSGMPQATEQPEYYALLLDVGRRDRNPYIRVYVAVDELDQPIGSVDFIEDMSQYGSGGSAGSLTATAGIRLLAVAPAWRQAGVGKTLIRLCIEQARAQRKLQVVLHTTRCMQVAWGMYERMGFVRFPMIDFQQGELAIYGFRLPLEPFQPGTSAFYAAS